MTTSYDCILLASFGGPDEEGDIMPFLENVVRGKPVPRERLLEVAEHYRHFGGSPINKQNLELIEALRGELDKRGVDLPIYFGNRNWKPYFTDALDQMMRDGKKRALAFFTSLFSCYSGCRQYRENIQNARKEVGDGAPIVEKVRFGYNHPKFIEAVKDRILQCMPSGAASEAGTYVLFTAHSIPLSMAQGCQYERQLKESCRLVAESCGIKSWELVFQSRSGSPHVPWLEPDICDQLKVRIAEKFTSFVVVPIGFVSDHMEVVWDLDNEAKQVCEDAGVAFYRAPTVGTHPLFVSMIADLFEERMSAAAVKPALGTHGPCHDVCPVDCCLPGTPAGRTAAGPGGAPPSGRPPQGSAPAAGG